MEMTLKGITKAKQPPYKPGHLMSTQVYRRVSQDGYVRLKKYQRHVSR